MPPPTNKCRKAAHALVEHTYFEPLILAVILFNTALIALDDQQVGYPYPLALPPTPNPYPYP